MASRMLHYVLAKEIMKRIEVHNMEKFVIGSLVPDASSHNDGSYDISHFSVREEVNGKKIKRIDWTLFESKYKEEIVKDSLYLGYLCHLIEDAIWFKRITDKYIRIYPKEERTQYIRRGYEDFQKLNSILIEQYSLSSPSIKVPEIKIDEVNNELLIHVFNDFYKDFAVHKKCDTTDFKIYPYDEIVKFMDESMEICVKEMNALRNGRGTIDPCLYCV